MQVERVSQSGVLQWEMLREHVSFYDGSASSTDLPTVHYGPEAHSSEQVGM